MNRTSRPHFEISEGVFRMPEAADEEKKGSKYHEKMKEAEREVRLFVRK